MPRFSFINNAKFRPFSYQEMLQPLAAYTQEYNAIEEGIGNLNTQANAIGAMANETNDPITYQRYKSYEESLRQQADNLAKQGLNPGSRKALLDLKSSYASDIIPIQNAIARKRELADEQRKALLQNPTLMFQRDFNTMGYDTSLDRFLENADYDYGERYSGSLLTQQVSQAASNLAKELSEYRVGKKLDPYTNTWLQRHGFSREQVLDAINNPDRANSQPVLNAIVESTMGASGITNWADAATLNKAYDYARQGLWSAIGQTNVSPFEDYGARLAARGEQDKALARYKAGMIAPQDDRHYKSVPRISTDTTKKTTEMKSDMDFLNEMMANPALIERKGKRYIPAQLSPTMGGTIIEGRFVENNPNLERLQNISKRYGMDLRFDNVDGNISADFTDNIKKLQSEINKSAMRQNSYIVDITDPSLISKSLKENILSYNRRTNKTGIYEVDDNKKGDQASKEDVINYFTDNIQLEYDPSLGIVLTGINSDGEAKSFVLDPEIVNGSSIGNGSNKVNQYQAVMNAINEAIENEDTESQEILIDGLMNDIYSRFNSISKRQGLTLSSKED